MIEQRARGKLKMESLSIQRHAKGLPLRGQRTKTNARTRKGPRKTVSRKKKK